MHATIVVMGQTEDTVRERAQEGESPGYNVTPDATSAHRFAPRMDWWATSAQRPHGGLEPADAGQVFGCDDQDAHREVALNPSREFLAETEMSCAGGWRLRSC